MYCGSLHMRPKLVSFRQRLYRSLAGMVIAALTMHGPAHTTLLTLLPALLS